MISSLLVLCGSSVYAQKKSSLPPVATSAPGEVESVVVIEGDMVTSTHLTNELVLRDVEGNCKYNCERWMQGRVG